MTLLGFTHLCNLEEQVSLHGSKTTLKTNTLYLLIMALIALNPDLIHIKN